MLTLNADPNIKDRTCLVVTDGLRATYSGGPNQPPQFWSLYPEQTPNTLLVTTDPVTNEYWARDLINAERVAHSWSPKPCSWIEQASGDPYYLGVSDPEQMEVIHFDPTGVENQAPPVTGGTFMAQNAPNPFSESTTMHFRLATPGSASIVIASVSGRIVRRLGERSYPAGYNQVHWDGRDEQGRAVPSGVYFARLEARRDVSTRRILVAR
jgi:hypothetical protein